VGDTSLREFILSLLDWARIRNKPSTFAPAAHDLNGTAHNALTGAVENNFLASSATGKPKDSGANAGSFDAAGLAAAAYSASVSDLSTHAGNATAHHSNANDPSAGEKAALAGTSGTPGALNAYVTNDDARNTNARTPSAHAASHVTGDDKLQFAATARAYGRNTSGSGDIEEVTIEQMLNWIASSARGDMLRRGATNWERFAKGTAGQVLTMGADDPAWAAAAVGTVYASPISWNMLTRAPDAIGQGTWVVALTGTVAYAGVFYNSSAANGDNFSVGVRVPSGTYTLRIHSLKETNRAIADIDIDGTEVHSVDLYAAASDFVISVTGLSLGGAHVIKIRSDGKNASSSGYVISVQEIELIRTGD